MLEWNQLMIAAIRLDNTGPTLSSRNLAMLHVAVYDAVNSIVRSHQPYHHTVDPVGPSLPEAAAHAAAYEVMRTLYPSYESSTELLYEGFLATAPPSLELTNGLVLGRAVAQLVLQERASDGASTDVPYIPSNDPGAWRRTGPFFRPPTTPQWRYVTPFCLPDIEAFVPAPPPALDSAEYAASWSEVRVLGGKTSDLRTAEQTQIAVFWSDFSYTAMPPGHWHLIADAICAGRGTSLADAARLFALISVAQADAAIVCWEAKYRYNLWRPVTAIQRADEDGNPATDADKTWESLLAAPPFPAYTSGHSTFSKASANVLARFFGTDAVEFDASSDALPGVVRHFHSFSACADEVGMSRIYGGIHYRFDNVEGKHSGAAVGDYVSLNFLLPVASLPTARIEGTRDADILLRLHGIPGRRLRLMASADLVHWSEAAAATAIPGGATVQDVGAAKSVARFYKVQQE